MNILVGFISIASAIVVYYIGSRLRHATLFGDHSGKSWHFFGHGDWYGPYHFGEIEKHTSRIPHAFLMATGVDDEKLKVLETFAKIGGLALVSPNITIESTKTIAALPELRELILCGPQISDEFLIRLVGITTLQELTLVHTACTEMGVRKFVDTLPKCKVYRGSEHSIYPAFDRMETQLFLRSS